MGRKKSLKIGFDVDGVLVEGQMEQWINYFVERSEMDRDQIITFHKDVMECDDWGKPREIFEDYKTCCVHNIPIRAYWKQMHLYNTATPSVSEEEFKNAIRPEDEILFISSSYDEHLDSKREFLNQNYNPYDQELNLITITGDHKKYIPCDIFMDDRPETCRLYSLYNPTSIVIQVKSDLVNVPPPPIGILFAESPAEAMKIIGNIRRRNGTQ